MFFPTLGLIATTGVISVDIHETIQSALLAMQHHNHRSIVVQNESIFYIITTKDIIALKMEGISFDTPLSQVSLRVLPMIDKESSVINALNLANEIDEHICVCNGDGSLYGLVTSSDIVSSVDPQVILDSLQIGTIFDKKFGFKSCTAEMQIHEILPFMQDALSDCIIVLKEDFPIGILTSIDMLQLIAEPGCESKRVSEVMSSPIETMNVKASISDALEFIKMRHYKRIVVVDDTGHVAGIVTQQDLIARTYLRWSQLVNEHFTQFEELTEILQQRNQHLTVLATNDALTGIHNRHMFGELFDKELASMKRYGTKLSLVMIDLDHFKNVNDTYGHNIGDYVLKTFSQTVKHAIRDADVFARWGGEEFVLLLPNSGCEEAYNAAEKIRQIVEAYCFDEIGQITCSLGITEVSPVDTLKSAVERADEALYNAKDGGRNCTIACKARLEKKREE
jgi:diguanylate cyclase (GGDEF)-like protein